MMYLATGAFKNLPDKHMYQHAVVRIWQCMLDKDTGRFVVNLNLQNTMDRLRCYKHSNTAIFGRQSRKDIPCAGWDPLSMRVSTNVTAHGKPTCAK